MDLETLEQEASICSRCSLYEGRKLPVFSKGNSTSKVMICGMAPATEENKVGIPFVGRAGKLLDELLKDAGWTLDDVYITNLVKCFLPAGLPLKSEWIDNCLFYIIAQITEINPTVILILGKDSSITLLGLNSKITMAKIKGKVFDYNNSIKVIPTYHPSYLLRGGGTKHKSYEEVLGHFKMVENYF